MYIISISDLNKNISDYNYIIYYFYIYAIAIDRFTYLRIKKELNKTLYFIYYLFITTIYNI